MKKLLADDLVAKYRSLPEFLWYIFAALSAFFANAYGSIVSAGNSAKEANAVLAETELPITVNPIALIVLTCVFTAVFYELIFELINHIASGVLLARFSAKTNRADLKFRLRLCYIYANILTGLIGISYFFTQITGEGYTGVFSPYDYSTNNIQMLLDSFVPFSFLTFFVYLFFEDTRIRFLPSKNHKRALTFIARIYFGIALVTSLIQCLLFISKNQSVWDIVSDWVGFGIRALWSGGAYLYYLHLKKNPTDDGNESITVIVEDNNHKNIYDDFGF